MEKLLIKNLTLADAEDLFALMGEKAYRGRQLFNWLYERNVGSFDDMTNFSKDLRRRLGEKFSVAAVEFIEKAVSGVDATEKYLFRTMDGEFIESVLIRSEADEDARLTVCVSCQAGCGMNCRFCQTARIGFRRNLETAEILDQLCHVRRLSGMRNNNIVFMGMGEPFMNYDNVLRAADIMNYTFGFHISVRKITISTCGILPGIERFIDEKRPYNLALSINDTDPGKRMLFMPVEKKYPMADIAKMLELKFPASRNRLTIEYVMRKDNISLEDAKRLKKMFKYSRIKINLIRLNKGDHNLEIPADEEVDAFCRELEVMNVPVSLRKSTGSDIDGACGQLSGRRYGTR
jgi:23S rRNA (adenine2503-C2)-methyltransferase